jgi:hypothetical protein
VRVFPQIDLRNTIKLELKHFYSTPFLARIRPPLLPVFDPFSCPYSTLSLAHERPTSPRKAPKSRRRVASRSTKETVSVQLLLTQLANVYRTVTDPLVHHGRHFGRAIHTFCNMKALLSNGMVRHSEADEAAELLIS